MKSSIKPHLFSIACLFVTFACGDSENPTDLQSPEISAISASSPIQPSVGQVFTPTMSSLPVSLKVSDPTGVKEILLDIHGGFDGHSHGRLNASFERLTVRKIFSATATDPSLKIAEGAREVIIDDLEVSWLGANSSVSSNVIAGPYHITISATDMLGNQTSFVDASNYHTTFYIKRPYAPVIAIQNIVGNTLSAKKGQPLNLSGTVGIGDHPLSSQLAFVWIRLASEDNLDEKDGKAEILISEHMWGKSNWRPLSGPSIASPDQLNLATSMSQNPIQIPSSAPQNLVLIVWAEDVTGNVSRLAFPVKVD